MTAAEIAAKKENRKLGERRKKAEKRKKEKKKEEELRKKFLCPDCGAEREPVLFYNTVHVICFNCNSSVKTGEIVARK